MTPPMNSAAGNVSRSRLGTSAVDLFRHAELKFLPRRPTAHYGRRRASPRHRECLFRYCAREYRGRCCISLRSACFTVHCRRIAAAKRGHETTAVVRSAATAADVLGAGAAVPERDAFSVPAEDAAGFDVVVNAFGTSPEQARQHVDLARLLVEEASSEAGTRLVFILRAGSLTNGEDNHLFFEDIRKIPGAEAWTSIPENQLKELEYLRRATDVDWVGVSPSSLFTPGEATEPVLGADRLLCTGRRRPTPAHPKAEDRDHFPALAGPILPH